MPTLSPEVDFYTKSLSKLGYGLPVYDPDPQQSYAVRIGDVGYIEEFGRFIRLFNVFYPEDDPINSRGVPSQYRLDERFNFPLRLHPLAKGVHRLKHVKVKQSGGLSFSS